MSKDASSLWTTERHRISWRFHGALIAVIALWLVLRVVYWNGYYVEDAPGYVTDAVYAALGNYHARDYVTGLNVGTYLPVAFPLKLFGKYEIGLSLWPLLSSFLGLLSIIGITGRLFGPRLGLLAGLLYATYPGDVFFSTVVMPDAIQAGWLTLSVFLIVSAYHGPTRHRPWILATGGITMGFCQLIRSNGLILLPIGVVAVLLFARLEKHPFVAAVRGTLTYLAGWFFVQALEGFGYLWANGDFLHRFHVVNRHYGTMQSIAQWGLNTSSTTIPFSIFPPLLWSRVGGWGVLNQDQAYHGFIFVLALASIGLGALALRFTTVPIPERAKAGFALGVFWFAWPLLYHQFGSQSLTHFVPIHRLSRHLVVYAPGAVFAATGGCFLIAKAASAWPWAAARKALAAAGIVVLGAHLAFNWEGQLIAFEAFHGIKRTYVRIREHLPADVRTIVGDPGDLCFFDFWLNPLGTERVRVVPFANYSRCEELPDGVVLTWSNPGWMGLSAPVIQDTVRRLPCLVQTPPSWRLLYDGSPEKIFVIGPVRAVKSR